jgi:hypothetical protein
MKVLGGLTGPLPRPICVFIGRRSRSGAALLLIGLTLKLCVHPLHGRGCFSLAGASFWPNLFFPKLPNADDVPLSERELEMFWGLHSLIFYMAIRRFVYCTPTPSYLDDIVRDSVNGLS